jgi:HSP20 family protein
MAIYPFDQPGYEQPADQGVWEQGLADAGVQLSAPTGYPPIDIVDNAVEIWVYVDLPGFQTDEIQVHGDSTTLVLSAERPSEIEEGRNVIVNERATRTERTIQLPTQVDISNAEMRYEDGVCKVVLPKVESERFTRIEFNSD